MIYALTDHLGTARLGDLQHEHERLDDRQPPPLRLFGNHFSETNSSFTILVVFTGRPFDITTGKQWNLNVSSLDSALSRDAVIFTYLKVDRTHAEPASYYWREWQI